MIAHTLFCSLFLQGGFHRICLPNNAPSVEYPRCSKPQALFEKCNGIPVAFATGKRNENTLSSGLPDKEGSKNLWDSFCVEMIFHSPFLFISLRSAVDRL